MSVSMGSDNVSLAIVLRGPSRVPTTIHPDIRTPNRDKKFTFSLRFPPQSPLISKIETSDFSLNLSFFFGCLK